MTNTQLLRHPLRGLLWGLVLGLGVAVLLTFVWPVVGLDNVRSVAIKWVAIVGAIMFISMLWGLFGPARRPRGAAPGYPAAGTIVYEQPPPALDEEPPPAPDELPPPPIEG